MVLKVLMEVLMEVVGVPGPEVLLNPGTFVHVVPTIISCESPRRTLPAIGVVPTSDQKDSGSQRTPFTYQNYSLN